MGKFVGSNSDDAFIKGILNWSLNKDLGDLTAVLRDNTIDLALMLLSTLLGNKEKGSKIAPYLTSSSICIVLFHNFNMHGLIKKKTTICFSNLCCHENTFGKLLGQKCMKILSEFFYSAF